MIRITGALAVTAVALIAVPAAAAHIEISPSSAAANSYTKLTFSVPHGCGESGTTSIRVQIPAGVTVTPQVNGDWQITTKQGTLPEPITIEGETITEGTTEVEWKGGPLPHDRYDEFGMSVHLPDKPGETLDVPGHPDLRAGRDPLDRADARRRRGARAPGADRDPDAAGADEHGSEAESGEETPVASEASAEASDESDDTRANIALALGAAALIVAVGGAAVALRHR